MENGEMKDRIRELMNSQGLTQQAFAQRLGISPASLSSIFQARTRPTLTHVEAIERSFPEVNIMWLVFGKGSMYASQEEASTPTTLASEIHDATVEQHAFDNQPALHFVDEPSPTPQQAAQSAPKPVQVREKEVIKYIDKPQRRITEIRIFYDDQTWETFVPKK